MGMGLTIKNDNMYDEDTLRRRLIGVTELAARYCALVENARESEREEFVAGMLDILPRLYLEFADIHVEAEDADDEPDMFTGYIDEVYYDSVRRHMEVLIGPDDVYLETFEEDMKYSDTPIAASVSESLADIFQPIFNFVSVVRDTDGESLVAAFADCKADFESYWSQTLCNVLRALNNIRYRNPAD